MLLNTPLHHLKRHFQRIPSDSLLAMFIFMFERLEDVDDVGKYLAIFVFVLKRLLLIGTG
jgi:hypothetical protein